MASVSKRDPASLLDFSVNVRPEGAPEFLRAALVRANTGLAAYPSPNAEEALAAAARRYGLPAGRFAFGNGSNELIHALAAYSKGAAHPAFPSSNRRSANTHWPAALPGWKAARSGAASVPVRTAAFRRSAGRACRNALGFGGVSGQSLQPFGAVPHARRMPVPAGGAARPALDHRRGLHRIRRAGSRCVDPAPDALQRRSTAFADQIPCLAGGAHRLSGGLGRTG